MIRHTAHSQQKVQILGKYVTEAEVLAKVNQYADAIEQAQAISEITIIIKKFDQTIKVEGVGENYEGTGQYICAHVDPRRRTIKTVTLRRKAQVERKLAEMKDEINKLQGSRK